MRKQTFFTLTIAVLLMNGCVTEPEPESTRVDTAALGESDGDGDAARAACHEAMRIGARACDAAYLPRLKACRKPGDPLEDPEVRACVEREMITLQECNAAARDALAVCLAAIVDDDDDGLADEPAVELEDPSGDSLPF